VDAVQAIAPAGHRAWHIDRVHPSAAGHRRLALSAAMVLADLDARYAVTTSTPVDKSTSATAPAVGQATARARLDALAERLPEAPDPPSAWQRLAWLVKAGLPWCLRRGRDFLPGLLRAVVHDLRAERAFTPGGMVTSLADSGLDPRRRIGRG
jgi:hypothetical protein